MADANVADSVLTGGLSSRLLRPSRSRASPRSVASFDRMLDHVLSKDDAVRSRIVDRATLAARRTLQVGSLLAIRATFSGADASRQPVDTSRAAVSGCGAWRGSASAGRAV